LIDLHVRLFRPNFTATTKLAHHHSGPQPTAESISRSKMDGLFREFMICENARKRAVRVNFAIENLRVEAARSMMEDGRHSIDEVAN
jgi:hypothetical protein